MVVTALSTSLDGFIAGVGGGPGKPLGAGGERLFELVRVVDAPGVTHLTYRVLK